MNIVIADDHDLIIEGFSLYIQKSFPKAEISSALNDQELFVQLAARPVDLLFQDIKFHNVDARDFLSEIKQKYPALRIIIISTLGDPYIVEQVFKKGVEGYVLKSDPSAQIGEAINTVMAGETFISSGLKSLVRAHKLNGITKVELTPRETEVLRYIVDEQTTKEIATQLFLSEKTVENHRANIMLKLKVKNTAGLVKRALLDGLI